MDDINIIFNLNSPQEKGTDINIKVENKSGEELLYKFFIGSNGVWDIIQDFNELNWVNWTPEEDGKYTIMVQAKKKDSSKLFDYVLRNDYIIGKSEEALISSLNIDKKVVKVGDKITATVVSNKAPIMYRYWIREEYSWNLIKDYSTENVIVFTAKTPGKNEILVECKDINSKNSYDDFDKIDFEILPLEKVEIKNFKCLTKELFVDSELIFQVDVNSSDNRTTLYKFVKINPDCSNACIQDYSNRRMVNFTEKENGDYKLLCYAKDMYSQKEYDDVAAINYKIKKYKNIEIKSFTTDKISPQICETEILLKAVVLGGRDLLYRYIIDGNYGEDSGYIRGDSYTWIPKMSGNYKIALWVKDNSFYGNYECMEEITFVIDEKSRDSVAIEEVVLDKGNNIIVGESIVAKAMATGSMNLRYSFIIKKDNVVKSVIDYGNTNWARFTATEEGKYELEIRVKDKYSTREYDSHEIVYINAYEYLPSTIEYVLYASKDYFLCGDKITMDVVTTNGKDTLVKYVLKINSHKVEESDYTFSKRYSFIPKRSGVYLLHIYTRNIKSKELFDSKRDIKIEVKDALMITDTKIKCDKREITLNEPVIFSVDHNGGKDVLYEFYMMDDRDWIKVQSYSKKKDYSFIPFSTGNFKILALCKSSYSKNSYEDYDVFEFEIK
ncbi:triple tyrosine motif-containing protein [Clostridium sp. MSJ-11]|uniref:Triple tyrosine motif-containing protein n=1 Tax=Clostridium mobile TaxID=2841512 RepID=A0ABS6EJH1_9CLOT|nr:triple tyrosine motif-containing protein [Clostridium mobile]MBU5485357.1 triple tyrosine motif-containing protein [Clostridium mobile]